MIGKTVSHYKILVIALAGYRIADLIMSAADDITAQRKFVGP